MINEQFICLLQENCFHIPYSQLQQNLYSQRQKHQYHKHIPTTKHTYIVHPPRYSLLDDLFSLVICTRYETFAEFNLYPSYQPPADGRSVKCGLRQVKGKHTHTHTSRELVTCSRQASRREGSGIDEGEWGQQSKRVDIGAVSWRCESVIIEHGTHIRTHMLMYSLCWEVMLESSQAKQNHASVPTYPRHIPLSTYTRTVVPPMNHSPWLGLRGHRTVKIYCSSCHMKSCSSMAVHVKKAFL